MIQSKLFVVFAAILLIAATSLVAAFYIQLWPLELLVSFAPTATTLLFTGVAVLASLAAWKRGLRQHLVATGLGAGALLLGIFSLGYVMFGHPSAEVATSSSSKQAVRFTTFNREFSNTEIERVSAYFRMQNSDVIALQETNPDVTKRISEQSGFTHYYNATWLNTVQYTSAALVSKYPILESQTYQLEAHSSLVKIVINIPKVGKMAFYSLHLTGPFNAQFYDERMTDNNSVIDILAKETLPYAIGGDFNTTVYSPGLRHFTNGIASSAKPTVSGVFPECSRFKGLSILCLRIDHIYIPQSASITKTTISPDLGSDHRALTVQFQF